MESYECLGLLFIWSGKGFGGIFPFLVFLWLFMIPTPIAGEASFMIVFRRSFIDNNDTHQILPLDFS